MEDVGVTHASVRNDFSEGSTGTPSSLYPEYLYDANGNMIEDKNKAIIITYNYLNLPSKVEYEDGRTIEYLYGTDGTKRRMIVKDPSVSLETNTDYLNAVVYEEGVIDYLMMDEGLVKNESGEYRYHYYLQDHLGNTRAVFRNDGGNVATLIQANSYYPFGLEMPELSYVSGSGETKYKYNGKEMQDAFDLNWIDYGARFYDPQIGRWHTSDPMASERVWVSPYNFVQNNPISRIDPTGALDDDYKVDQNGSVSFVKKTDDEVDNLYATDKDGNIDVERSIEVDKGILNNIKSGKHTDGTSYDFMKMTGDRKATNLFEFLSNNTSVEWSQTKFGENKNYLSTSHEEHSEAGGADILYKFTINGYHVREQNHSHPSSTTGPSGYHPSHYNSNADRMKAEWVNKWNSNVKLSVYEVKTKSYIKYNHKGIIK